MAMVVSTRISAMPRCWTGEERISEVQGRREEKAGLRRPGPLLSLLVEHGEGDADARRQHGATGTRGCIGLPLVTPFPGRGVPGLDGEAEHVLRQDGFLSPAVRFLIDLGLHPAKERRLAVGVALEAVVEDGLVGLLRVDVQPLVGERGHGEDRFAAAILESEERGPLAEALAVVVLGEERHRYFAGDPVERPAHRLIPFLGAFDPPLQIVCAVEALPGQTADERHHRDGDHHLEQGEAAPVHGCVPRGVTCCPGCGGTGAWNAGFCGWPAPCARMTTICDADTERRSFPSVQLTVNRISRTLFLRVSMKVVACPCRMPPMGPLIR